MCVVVCGGLRWRGLVLSGLACACALGTGCVGVGVCVWRWWCAEWRVGGGGGGGVGAPGKCGVRIGAWCVSAGAWVC